MEENPNGDPDTMTDSLIRNLGVAWIGISLRAQRVAVAGRIERLQAKLPDPRQLDLPGFEHLPASILDDSVEKYDTDTAKLGQKIRDYLYPRRTDANLKRDRAIFRERMRLRKNVTPILVRHPEIGWGKAVELYRAKMETPASRRNRKGGKIRQTGRTKNQ
ncbi:MAG: hypothetical protein WDO73_02820 [Ignavibacteriota bacterium]